MTGGMGGTVGGEGSGGVTVAEQTRIAGSYLLTACAANRQALSPPGERHTAFTGEPTRSAGGGLGDPTTRGGAAAARPRLVAPAQARELSPRGLGSPAHRIVRRPVARRHHRQVAPVVQRGRYVQRAEHGGADRVDEVDLAVAAAGDGHQVVGR